ncbi:MAG: glycosyltransferase [Actinobacteria bacterium]|nr:glycosyltransferase [Actinomycetota bacterium]MBU1943259.1 glycosyltransferase [Actinomycetota bacterium]MBU2688992.1 glycosyltransferase [Actinomycetota bacterium]
MVLLKAVPLPRSSLDDYAPFVGFEAVEVLRAEASDLEGSRVLHISSTPYGGGVAELLYTIVPLMRDLGLDADWFVLDRDDDFFTVTKILHNALQGMGAEWVPEMTEKYFAVNEANAEAFLNDYEFVIVHDPQPAAIPMFLDRSSGRLGQWVWRCHLDLSAPVVEAWRFIEGLLDHYSAAVFTTAAYIPEDLGIPGFIIAPSIDPTSPKNIPLSLEIAASVVARYGVDPAKPYLLQVSRFDPWKDPIGVIEAYLLARAAIPDLQLVLIGSMAEDDPEGFYYFQKASRRAEGLDGVFLLTNAHGIGNVGVNAFQVAADVVLQKSIREGFGLTVSEALWKGKAVVAGNVGGIPLQVSDGTSGFLVDSVEECAEKVLLLLNDPGLRESFGRAGRETVRRGFLTTRHVLDYLHLFKSLGR